MKKFIKPLLRAILFIFLIAGTLRSFGQVAAVNPPTGGFNINGQVKVNSAVGDWTVGTTGTGGYVLQQTGGVWGPVNASTTKFVRDEYDNATDLIFQSSSFGDNPNTWQWTASKATAKCDINTALFHSTTSATQKWLILGGDRFATTGTSYIDFQFSQGVFTRNGDGTFSSVAADGTTSLAATNGRTVGDFVLSMEYTNGGAVATVHYYRWELSGSSYKFVEKTIPAPGGVASAFGASNSVATDVPYGAFGSTSYIPFAFVEAAVNIDAILTGSCQTVNIKTIFVSTKASDSYSAALKDFVDPQPVNFVFGNAGLNYGATAFCKQGTVAPTVPAPADINGTFSGSAGLSINSTTGVINLAGTDAGTYTATYTPSGGVCLSPATAVITVNPLPTITLGTNPEVCRGATSASLSYSATTGTPTTYSINFDATAEAAGFGDVTDASLGASPISITVPASAAAATYNGVLTVKTAATCVSSNYNITVKINALPSASIASITLCESSLGSGTASFNLPGVNNTVTGGAAGVGVTWFSNSGLTTSIGTPGAFVSGSTTVYAKVTVTATGCFNFAAVTLTVNAKPTITISANPTSINLAAGTTSQLSIATITPGVVADYNYSWSVTGTPDATANASLSNNTTATPTLNILSPFVEGNYTSQVTATNATTTCANTQTKIVAVSAPGAQQCAISGTSPVCPGTTNTYKYDINNDGTAEAIPSGYTAAWTFVGGANGASFSGATNGNSVNVVAGTGCNTSFTIKISFTTATGIGNFECQRTITVVDATKPVFTSCPADVVVECSASITPASIGSATATDGCSTPTVTSQDATNTVGCVTNITRTWKAIDACGNSATCVQHITKRDRTAPVITCHGANPATATDNCSSAGNITIFLSNGVWTAIDESGNMSTCAEGSGSRIATTQITEEKLEVVTTDEKQTKTALQVKQLPAGVTVQTIPNPFTERVRFIVTSQESGYGTLDVMNMLGQKVKTVFQGQMNAGSQSFEMVLPSGRYSTLFYILRINGKQVTGKLVQRN